MSKAKVRLTRRSLLASLPAGVALGAGWGEALAAASAGRHGKDWINLRSDGTYDTVPLRKPVITLGVVQSRVRAVDARNAVAGRKANLAHMLELIDDAQHGGLIPHQDLLLFHEFVITGYTDRWNRADTLRVAIEVPGEETEAIGAKAREHGCYIVFGSYVRDRDWPGHVLSIATTIGPDGTILNKSWKARNIQGVWGPGFELLTSTIFDNLDRFVEMYGWDAVVPVIRTDIGNFSTTSTQREPELVRAAAMKGCEILLRTATGGFSELDVQANAYYNSIYSCVVNNSVSPGDPGFFPSEGLPGGSAIYGPQGQLLTKATSDNAEQRIMTQIPIAQFRSMHRQPLVCMELYRPVFDRYVSEYPPNLLAGQLPATPQEMARYVSGKSRWAKLR